MFTNASKKHRRIKKWKIVVAIMAGVGVSTVIGASKCRIRKMADGMKDAFCRCREKTRALILRRADACPMDD